MQDTEQYLISTHSVSSNTIQIQMFGTWEVLTLGHFFFCFTLFFFASLLLANGNGYDKTPNLNQ